ncbi:PIN domain-containing protein [[Clostridium] innocuum]|uniref:PIN domain-containing protein n=1 Tax=Clostridium innocuum TaxID=1522 RepID=UPI000D6AE7CA|nr:PIN domain-containing protein [[Clostridium] innocuum]PWJ12053.1 hypothetical protein ATF84_115101 [[Clostridium] innocuum]SSA47682.1 hypothetical protein SAMN04487929_115101 [[Clostridium] innocuum]
MLEKLKNFFEISLPYDMDIESDEIISNDIYKGKNIYLIDFENIPNIDKDIRSDTNAYIFIFSGIHQHDKVNEIMRSYDIHGLVQTIQLNKHEKNYLDCYLSCWIGNFISLYSPRTIFIVSRDKGYNGLIHAIKSFGFDNIGYYTTTSAATISDTQIKKLISASKIIYSDRLIKKSQLKKSIKKKLGPEVSGVELNDMIDKAVEMNLITFVKEKNIEYVYLK